MPWDSYTLLPDSQKPTTHKSDNGSGSLLTREFCGTCGGGIREWGEQAEGKSTYVCYGGLEETGRKELPPKGEFFVRKREEWMKDIGGKDVFKKQEIKD